MVGAIIAAAAWGIILAWLIGTLVRIVLREQRHNYRQTSDHQQAELASAERERQERLRRQQRQIEALDALYELPSPSHRGGRTR